MLLQKAALMPILQEETQHKGKCPIFRKNVHMYILQKHVLNTHYYLLHTYFCVIIPTQHRNIIVKISAWFTDEELEVEQCKQQYHNRSALCPTLISHLCTSRQWDNMSQFYRFFAEHIILTTQTIYCLWASQQNTLPYLNTACSDQVYFLAAIDFFHIFSLSQKRIILDRSNFLYIYRHWDNTTITYSKKVSPWSLFRYRILRWDCSSLFKFFAPNMGKC